MASQIHDDELSMSFTNVSQTRSRPSLPIVSPPSRPPVASTPPAESPAQARAAQRLNQYQLVRNIGEGSFGKVKLARHRHTGQEVAMKIINRRKLISRDLAGRIEREIQYLQLLRHPHIIKLYSVITTKTEIVMVLEYVPMELFDYIVKHGRLAENKARKLFQQIISAVEYCHRHKIVHRDLKPENLLLDKNMNVKIADFGLSNIMTDGNFLRTSCGSPNYAAPEVIGGKLYAGPEVDVWSCGVILYVFLVGRLPFDDEFIPALFRKIQAGTFHIPSQTPPGAADLIKRCLMVHPVQRIQIPEIRRHEWFMKDLPAYLKEPAEEFLDTGVDSSKAIDPQQLAPGKTPQVVAEIHEKVVDKLGRAMGYPKPDIQDALSKDEPSAIKDAYLIVHENELMVETSQYNGTGAELESFLATSPPVEPNYPKFPGSPRVTHGRGADDIKPLTPTNSMDPRRVSRTMSDTSSLAMREEERPRISTVKVLNTSLPNVHEDVMRARDKLRSESRDPDEMFRLPSLDKATQPKSTTVPIPEEVRDPSGALIELPEEKRAEIARALKPHSRSSTNLAALQATTREPEKLPAVPEQAPEKKLAPKAKTRRWQFGIRSRNQPYEAMKCLYQALKQCGAEWEVLPAVKTSHHDQEPNGNDDEEGDEDPELDMNPLELEPGQRHTILQSKYDFLPSDYYVPRDNWNIRARILKKGALPGEVGLVSGHSSAVSLSGDATQQLKRHIEELSGHVPEEVMRSLAANGPTGNMAQKLKSTSQQASRPSSGIGDHPNNAHISAVKDSHSRPESSYSLDTSKMTAKNVGIWVFIDIQLYTLDTQTYVVDFKCDGYQSVLWCEPKHKSGTTPNSNAASAVTSPAASRPQSSVMEESHLRRNLSYEVKKAEGYWKPISKRFKNVEKEASSPYPYLDVASDLVAQLASG